MPYKHLLDNTTASPSAKTDPLKQQDIETIPVELKRKYRLKLFGLVLGILAGLSGMITCPIEAIKTDNPYFMLGMIASGALFLFCFLNLLSLSKPISKMERPQAYQVASQQSLTQSI